MLLFFAVLSEGILGVASAGQSTSNVTPLLIGHVAFGTVVVALAGWALTVALRQRGRPGVLTTAFTALAVAFTATTGAVFLITGFPNGAAVDRGLALLSLLGTVLMMVWGSPRGTTPL